MTERGRRFLEDDLEIEDLGVEGDEACQVLGEDRDVVDAGERVRRKGSFQVFRARAAPGRERAAVLAVRARAPSSRNSMASAAASAASVPSMSQ